jgi:hypothetical protein
VCCAFGAGTGVLRPNGGPEKIRQDSTPAQLALSNLSLIGTVIALADGIDRDSGHTRSVTGVKKLQSAV